MARIDDDRRSALSDGLRNIGVPIDVKAANSHKQATRLHPARIVGQAGDRPAKIATDMNSRYVKQKVI
jgi:hypothetical protein